MASSLRSALWLPLFDELADPRVIASLAAEAEEAGWHGFFVWDHLFWRAPVRQAVATLTDLRDGDMGSYDVATSPPAGVDPEPYARAGATWWLPEFEPGVRVDTVRGVLREGPAR